MKAFLIARVSTEDQMDALPAQVMRLRDYAERRGFDYEIVEFQESAYKGERMEFKEVLHRILACTDKVAVVFDKIDRFSRDSSAEEVRILQKLAKQNAIELHFPSDNLSIDGNSPATDIMRLGLGTVLAQYYSDAISDNVKRRLEQKLRDGEITGRAPFGYINTVLPDGKKHVLIDAYSGDIVRHMYEWYASGSYSIQNVRKELMRRYGMKTSIAQIDLILKNPFYYGEMLVKGVLYPHKYEPLISRELYDQCEDVRQDRHVNTVRYDGPIDYPYRSLIRCADCDCRVTFETKKGKYIYGHCTQRKGNHNATYVRQEIVTEQLMRYLESIVPPDEVYQAVAERRQATIAERLKSQESAKQELQREIGKIESRGERLYDDYSDGLITREMYMKKVGEHEAALKDLKRRLQKLELIAEPQEDTVLHLMRLAQRAAKSFIKADSQKKRSLILLLGSNLVLDGDLLRWQLKKPYDLMAFCSKNQNWLRQLGSNQRHPR